MNYYPHHIGDFNSATRHLTRVERSIYRDLMDLYYDTERPIINDIDKLCRLIIARSDEERTAVEQVLNEFFIKTDDGWFHDRCDEEIQKYQAGLKAKSAAGKASAAKRARKTQQKLNEEQTEDEQPLNSSSTDDENSLTLRSTNQNQEPEPRTKKEEAAAAPPPRACAPAPAHEAAPPAAPPDPGEPAPPEPPGSIPDEAPARATQIAVLLRRNGADHRIVPNDRRIADWARDSVTDAELLQALEAAKARRKTQGSDQPIGTAYLAPIVAEIRAAPPPSSPAGKTPALPPQDQWWRSDAGIDRKARELGMYARPTEDYASFKDRIFETLRQRQTQGATA